MMTESVDIIDHIKKYEGFRKHPYRCPAGALTIGYGFNLDANPLPVVVADKWLEELVVDCLQDLVGIFPEFWRFTTQRKVALIDMRYNLGPKRFRSFEKLIAAVLAGDWQEAQLQALDSKWARDVGHRAIVDAGLIGDSDNVE